MQIAHPYTNLTGGAWLRGNLHTHTTRSDGARDQQTVINDYAARGYHFLMLSDHDILTSPEDYAKLDARGMTLIPGNEISAAGPHMLHVGATKWIDPKRQRQAIISEIVAEANGDKRGPFVIVNHPDWFPSFDHCSIHQLREWVGYVGMEIYNGVIGRLDGSPYALNKWDILLSEGKRVWGFANDDSHAAVGDVELGWNTVYTADRSPAGIVEAMGAGRFYASTGVTITDIRVTGDTIRVETKDAHRIVALTNSQHRLAIADSNVIEIEAPEKSSYVRFECWGAGEKFAWTQPFYLEPDANSPTRVAFIEQWNRSNLIRGAVITDAKIDSARGTAVAYVMETSTTPHGYVDARRAINGEAGLVYLTSNINTDADRRATLYLGYDGPVRVWFNGTQVFDGPGNNPAVPDKTAVAVQLRKGGNALVIALDSNEGKAWGVFARVV